ncbi:hypothetical protein GCM10022249_04520 [Enteractinococcus coprophilus]|jgi:hypothetical protein
MAHEAPEVEGADLLAVCVAALLFAGELEVVEVLAGEFDREELVEMLAEGFDPEELVEAFELAELEPPGMVS